MVKVYRIISVVEVDDLGLLPLRCDHPSLRLAGKPITATILSSTFHSSKLTFALLHLLVSIILQYILRKQIEIY